MKRWRLLAIKRPEKNLLKRKLKEEIVRARRVRMTKVKWREKRRKRTKEEALNAETDAKHLQSRNQRMRIQVLRMKREGQRNERRGKTKTAAAKKSQRKRVEENADRQAPTKN